VTDKIEREIPAEAEVVIVVSDVIVETVGIVVVVDFVGLAMLTDDIVEIRVDVGNCIRFLVVVVVVVVSLVVVDVVDVVLESRLV